MISIGRSIRWYNPYHDEVGFCVRNGFSFLQLWYKNGDIRVDSLPPPKAKAIRQVGFPVILHAVFTPDDFQEYGDRLLDLVDYFGSREVIVHPVCGKAPAGPNTQYRLAEQAKRFSGKAMERGVIWYLENNSVIDVFHYRKEDLEVVYNADPYVEQLLDVAHIDNYRHLQEIIGVKFPKCLHVAGKHFSVAHEHLPLAQGDIDYNLIFQEYLKGYDGRIILEVDGTDEEIIRSGQIITEAIQTAKE